MNGFRPGITIASLVVSFFALLLMAMLGQQATVLLNLSFPLEHSLAAPAVQVLVLLTFVVGLVYLVAKVRILSRAELLCVFFAMVMAAPLMTQGFWQRIISITATIPRSGDFTKLDSLNDRLWPHGRNLLADALTEGRREQLVAAGQLTWEDVEFEKDRRAAVAVLRNDRKDQVTSVRVRVPVQSAAVAGVAVGESYLVSALVRAQDLTGDSFYYCRAHADGAAEFSELFRDTVSAKVTFAHQTGFVRVGTYGVKFSSAAREFVDLEFGLMGPGQLELWDPKLFNVEALEAAYTGRVMVRQSEYDRLPPEDRGGLLVKPDNMWSLAGLKFVLGGYIPWGDWWEPLATWSALFGLITLAMLAVNVIMRRQWADNERYPFPLTRVPLALLGEEGEEAGALPAIWKNPLMWIGFGVTLVWCLLRLWNFYNPKVPDVNLSIPLLPYFTDPKWGGMWNNVTFSVTAIYLGLALFMELNVLLSLVVGYFFYRSMFRLGAMTGWNANTDFPYGYNQMVAAYITYGLLIIFFTRKYLSQVLRAALKGDKEASAGEIFTYRTAFIVLALTIVGAMMWGRWLAISPLAILVYFLYILVTGFVAAKFRTECGAPWGYYTPSNAFLFLTLVGGFGVFGADGMLVCVIASFLLFETVFFLLPGMQLELAELGRRFQVKPRHLLYTCLLGLGGGLVIGGWVFLSNAYSLGGDTVSYKWAFDTKSWYFNQYNVSINEATGQLLGQHTAHAETGISPRNWAYTFAVAMTTILTVLRQYFAGFWFHPFGYIMGSTFMMMNVWGSCLLAWAIRLTVLKLGGAATVKNRLIPFAVGVFLAGVFMYLVMTIHGTFLLGQNVDRIYIMVP